MNLAAALLRYLTRMRIVFVADVDTASGAMILKKIEIETLFGVVD
jgi:glucose-6-phosphate isomerase